MYAIPFRDARERSHVVAVVADTPEEALRKVITFQCQDEGKGGWYYNGFSGGYPQLNDVVEINPGAHDDDVQILWHDDYD